MKKLLKSPWLELSLMCGVVILSYTALRLVDWEETVKKFPWESWLVFGAGVSLGMAMLQSGAGLWLANVFLPAYCVVYYNA